MKCPVCKDKTLTLSERKGIEIDFCGECRGIWLDRGELDKILERSKEEAVEVRKHSDRDYDDYRHKQSEKPYKRKKSFLEEIFD